MQITLVKHQDRIEIISGQNELPLDVPVVLYSSDEVARQMGYTPSEILQLESILSDNDEDWGADLDALSK